MINFENNPLIEKSVQFSLDIIEFCELLEKTKSMLLLNNCCVPEQVSEPMHLKHRIRTAKMILSVK